MLSAPSLVNDVVTKYYGNLAYWILGNDMLQLLDELSGLPSVEDDVRICLSGCPLRRTRSSFHSCRVSEPAAVCRAVPRRPEGWKQMQVAFIFAENAVVRQHPDRGPILKSHVDGEGLDRDHEGKGYIAQELVEN